MNPSAIKKTLILTIMTAVVALLFFTQLRGTGEASNHLATSSERNRDYATTSEATMPQRDGPNEGSSLPTLSETVKTDRLTREKRNRIRALEQEVETKREILDEIVQKTGRPYLDGAEVDGKEAAISIRKFQDAKRDYEEALGKLAKARES